MKSRKVFTKEDIEDYYFALACGIVGDSICVMMLALNEELGIGKERAKRVIERYFAINRHYNEYGDDVRREREIKQRMKELDLEDCAQHLYSRQSVKRYHQEYKKQNEVSVVEAANMQKQLKLMKELVNSNK